MTNKTASKGRGDGGGQLQRALGLPSLIFYGVGTMIGAGIYSVIGAAAGEAGHLLPVSFLLAGVAAFLAALSYAEMASIVSKTGAEYQFLKFTFPQRRWLSFMAGYLIAIHTAASAATVSVAFAGYLNVFFPVPTALAAFGLLTACTVINIIGIRESTWVSIALIVIEVMGLLLVIWAGFFDGAAPAQQAQSQQTPAQDGSNQGLAGIFAASALIFFVFFGFEDMVNLSEEAHEPKRDVPRALVIAVLITLVLYVAVGMAVSRIGDPAALAESDSPLTEALSASAPWRGQALAVAAIVATASTALIAMIACSRLLFGMARDGDMPKALSRTWQQRKTPWVAALALFAVAILLLPLGEVKILASISSVGVILAFIAIQVALIYLRRKRPEVKPKFRIPLNIAGWPVTPVLAILALLALLTQFEPVVYMISAGVLVAGAVVHLARKKFG